MSLPRLKREFQSVCRVAHTCVHFFIVPCLRRTYLYLFSFYFFTLILFRFLCTNIALLAVLFCFAPVPSPPPLPVSHCLSDGARHTQVFVLFLLLSWYISFDWSDKMRSEPVERRVGAHKKFRKVIV